MSLSGVFLFLWVLPGLLPDGVPTLAMSQQLDLLEQANRAFEQALASPVPSQAQAHYQNALAIYEQLRAAGIENARLHYNLGNIYFRLDDLGRAIAAYRRGLRLEPGNPRLQANLRYALSLRVDQIEAREQSSVWSRLLFWQDALSLGSQFALAVVSFLLAWACAFARLFWRRPTLGWLLFGCACGCILFTGSSLAVHFRHTATRHGVIVADNVDVRKGNGDSYTLQLPNPLHRGTEFVVLEERGAWLSIRLANGVSGWIRREQAVQW
jgi:hypothetical protein